MTTTPREPGAASPARNMNGATSATEALQAERVVAAACLTAETNAATLDAVFEMVTAGMLTRREPAAVVAAVTRLREQGQPIDPAAVADEMAAYGTKRADEEVTKILRTVPSAAIQNVLAHAKRVRDAAERRRALQELRQCATVLGDPNVPLAGAVQGLRQGLEGLVTAGGRAKLVSLAELLADPEALQPPLALIPRLAWRGRVSLFAAREKLGKSTFATAALAAKSSGGEFLGQAVTPANVLYVNLEEHAGDIARRLVQFGAAPDRVHILSRVSDAFTELEAAVRACHPECILVDTLATFTAGLELDPSNSSHWVRVMAKFTALARDTDAGIVLIHHARKSDGGYRDSSAIGGGVDHIITMTPRTRDDERAFESVGRWGREKFNLRLAATGCGAVAYRVVGKGASSSGQSGPAAPPISLNEQVIAFVSGNPGCSGRDVVRGVSGRTQDTLATVRSLLASRRLVNAGGSGAMRLRVAA